MKKLAALLIAICPACAAAPDLPAGWRMPTTGELSDEARKDNPTKFAAAKADFNGDGIADEAFLLKSTGFSGEGLWVKLSTPAKTFSWVKLDEINWGPQYPHVNVSMGLSAEPPGSYPYSCFDEEKDCNASAKHPNLELRNPVLDYFRFGSASSIFFWSDKDGRFRRAWTGD